jgi:hypothetical protein
MIILTKTYYVIAKLEALAIIFVMKTICHYLLGNKFIIVNDYYVFKCFKKKFNHIIGRISKEISLI